MYSPGPISIELYKTVRQNLLAAVIISSLSIDKNHSQKFSGNRHLSTFYERKKQQFAANFETKMDEKQAEILRNIISGQEREKNHIGRELHDNINQVLATVKMYLGIARADKARSEEMVEISFNYIDQLITEIRGLSHSLVSPSLGDITLSDALKQMADEVNIGRKIDVRLIDMINGSIDDQNKEVTFYRIAQEQMSNILKHAQASKVVISLENKNDHFTMIITDNGAGFNPTRISEGIGFQNIYNRLSVYGGKMSIQSAPGQGCTLEVSIPKK
jgi:signal transduction histidine kinase